MTVHDPLRYRCNEHPNKKLRPILYHNLLKGKGCRACSQVSKDTERIEQFYPIAKQAFTDQGLILVDTEYVNAKFPMRYTCPKHPEELLYKSYDGIKSSGCPLCGNEAQGDRQRPSQDSIAEACYAQGFILLEGQIYKNAHQTLAFQCLKHPKVPYTSTVDTILSGRGGCIRCKGEKISEKQIRNFAEGRQKIRRREENPTWKGGTTQLNYHLRQRETAWKRKWLKAHDYTCVASGERGGQLHVHHTEPFHLLRDQTPKNLKLPLLERVSDYSSEQMDAIEREYNRLLNGVEGFPLKPEIHKQFHQEYGHSTTKAHFIQFIERINK